MFVAQQELEYRGHGAYSPGRDIQPMGASWSKLPPPKHPFKDRVGRDRWKTLRK